MRARAALPCAPRFLREALSLTLSLADESFGGNVISNKRTLVIVCVTVAAMLLTGLVGAVLVAYSGRMSVAADVKESPLVVWFLTTTQKHSVTAAAKGLKVPDLRRPELSSAGGRAYHEMCSSCHGAPGLPASVVGLGLNPPPPDLQKAPSYAGENAANAFWVIKHGIRMTGMPSFGKTHKDEELWEIVAFLETARTLSPEQYRQRVTPPASLSSTRAADPVGDSAAAPVIDEPMPSADAGSTRSSDAADAGGRRAGSTPSSNAGDAGGGRAASTPRKRSPPVAAGTSGASAPSTSRPPTLAPPTHNAPTHDGHDHRH